MLLFQFLNKSYTQIGLKNQSRQNKVSLMTKKKNLTLVSSFSLVYITNTIFWKAETSPSLYWRDSWKEHHSPWEVLPFFLPLFITAHHICPCKSHFLFYSWGAATWSFSDCRHTFPMAFSPLISLPSTPFPLFIICSPLLKTAVRCSLIPNLACCLW